MQASSYAWTTLSSSINRGRVMRKVRKHMCELHIGEEDWTVTLVFFFDFESLAYQFLLCDILVNMYVTWIHDSEFLISCETGED
jgi:hypothetical protein